MTQPINDWYNRPLDARAHAGGEEGVDGKEYKGGEYLPKYVPRPVMPQVDECDLDALLAFLTGKGITIEHKTLPCDVFSVKQRVDEAHVKSILSPANAALLLKPVLASLEPDILDGNHRLAAHKIARSDVPAIVIGLAFEDAIKALFEFPKTYTIEDTGSDIRN